MFPKLRIGLCQIRVGADKALNIVNAGAALVRAKEMGSDLVVLPECWNCPYSTASFPEYAETIPRPGESDDLAQSPSVSMLCQQAKDLGIWLVGGSVPEQTETTLGRKIYNTSLVINPDGNIVGKHRKVHLFDIDVPGRVTFKESDSLTGGDSVTVVDTPWGGLGVGICYDIRFPELAGIMRQRGANLIIYPGAFNMTTGPAHWELLQRARAVDNQVQYSTLDPGAISLTISRVFRYLLLCALPRE
jgi:omega-amidase